MNLQTENCIWPRLFQAQLGSQIVGMTRKGIFSCSHFLNFADPTISEPGTRYTLRSGNIMHDNLQENWL